MGWFLVLSDFGCELEMLLGISGILVVAPFS